MKQYSIFIVTTFTLLIGLSSCQKQMNNSLQLEDGLVEFPLEHHLNSLPQPSDGLIISDRKAHPEVYKKIDSILKADVNERFKNRGKNIPASHQLLGQITAISNSAIFPNPTWPASLSLVFQWEDVDFSGPITYYPLVTASRSPKSFSIISGTIYPDYSGVRAYIMICTGEWYYVGTSGATFTVNYRAFGNIFEDQNNLGYPTLTLDLIL